MTPYVRDELSAAVSDLPVDLALEPLHFRGGQFDLAVARLALLDVVYVVRRDGRVRDIRGTGRSGKDPEVRTRPRAERVREVLQPGDVERPRDVHGDDPEHRDIPLVLRVQHFHDDIAAL